MIATNTSELIKILQEIEKTYKKPLDFEVNLDVSVSTTELDFLNSISLIHFDKTFKKNEKENEK